MMFLLGLLLPICFIPGYTGASIPTQWALLSVALPILLGWAALPWACLAFIGYAALGTLWAPQPYDTVFGIWLVVLWCLSFQLGRVTESPHSLYRGLAIGVSVSSIIAIFQWLGYSPVMVIYGGNAGLLYNSTVLGATSALLILALLEFRLWAYIPVLLPGLWLSHSRGAWVILLAGLASRIHWSLAFGPAILAAFLYSNVSSSDAERLQIWNAALHGLTWFGWSAGSFIDVYIVSPQAVVHPEYVHNDYLQFAFEFGIAAIIPIAILPLALVWRPTMVVFGFAILATFYFPLYAPLSAFIGCFALGHSLRGFSPSGLIIRHCRPDLLPWVHDPEPEFNHVGI